VHALQVGFAMPEALASQVGSNLQRHQASIFLHLLTPSYHLLTTFSAVEFPQLTASHCIPTNAPSHSQEVPCILTYLGL
jgi:hypothetical protein